MSTNITTDAQSHAIAAMQAACKATADYTRLDADFVAKHHTAQDVRQAILARLERERNTDKARIDELTKTINDPRQEAATRMIASFELDGLKRAEYTATEAERQAFDSAYAAAKKALQALAPAERRYKDAMREAKDALNDLKPHTPGMGGASYESWMNMKLPTLKAIG